MDERQTSEVRIVANDKSYEKDPDGWANRMMLEIPGGTAGLPTPFKGKQRFRTRACDHGTGEIVSV